jgi:HEAT repeat protein
MSARLFLIALVFVFALPLMSVIANDELPKTPRAFEERVDVLLGVDQDTDAVRVLAKRVMKAHGDKQPWAAALVNAGVRAGEAGHRIVALDILQPLTGERGNVLEAADRTRVALAMQRWGQSGDPDPAMEDSLILRVGREASPMETKVRELFAPLTAITDRKEQNSVKNSITAALVDAGPEILGVLARIASDSPGAVGRLAGEILAKRGGDAARPYLARMLASDSPLTRGTAVRSLADLPRPEAGTWWQAHGDFIERVTKDASASEREHIRTYVLLRHLQNDELWARYQQGGEDARHFLQRLARNGDPRAFKEAIAGIANDDLPEADREVHRSILVSTNPNQRGRVIGDLLADVDKKTIRAVVDVFRESIWTGFGSQHSALWALGRWQGDQEAREAIADEVWMDALRRISLPETAPNQVNYVASMLRHFVNAGYMPPVEICQDEVGCREFFANFHQIFSGSQTRNLFEEQPALFERMFDILPKLDTEQRKHLLGRVLGAQLPPSTRWSELLALAPFDKPSGRDGLLPSVIIELAKADDPALWPWIRKHVEEAGYPEDMQKVVRALAHRPDEQLLAFAERALARAEGMDLSVLGPIMNLLDHRHLDLAVDTPYGARSIEILSELAADPAHPAAVLAVHRLSALEQDTRLVPLFAQALDMPRPLPEGWREALVRVADARLLVEAAPFLVEQYRQRREQHVAKVLDKLREHRERLASFENWRAEDGRAAVDELLAQLDSQDAAERRIAVVALAALREQRAIPKLAKLALKDPDAAVRTKASAALEALANLAR